MAEYVFDLLAQLSIACGDHEGVGAGVGEYRGSLAGRCVLHGALSAPKQRDPNALRTPRYLDSVILLRHVVCKWGGVKSNILRDRDHVDRRRRRTVQRYRAGLLCKLRIGRHE